MFLINMTPSPREKRHYPNSPLRCALVSPRIDWKSLSKKDENKELKLTKPILILVLYEALKQILGLFNGDPNSEFLDWRFFREPTRRALFTNALNRFSAHPKRFSRDFSAVYVSHSMF